MGKLVMAYWDCPFCGTQGVRGDVVNCPSCGRARGEVKFYMKDHTDNDTREANETGDIEYLDEEKAKTFSKNPDWYCSFCNSLNSDNAAFCSNCGATRESSEANYFEMHKKKEEREKANQPVQAAPTRSAPKSKRSLFIILAILLIIIGGIVFMNGNKTSGDLTVSAVSWGRAIQIEENIEYQESGWNLPAGAEETGQKTELHHYDSVLDHYESVEVERSRQVIDHYETYYTYEDRGNGTFEEIPHERPVYTTEYYTETVQQPVYVQVPRYATKYYYNIWRWTPTRIASSSGEDQQPFWPETNLAENEREGDRKEEYRFTVTVNKDNSTAVYSLAEADWNNLKVGDTIYITAKRTGADAYISDQKGNKIADIERVN